MRESAELDGETSSPLVVAGKQIDRGWLVGRTLRDYKLVVSHAEMTVLAVIVCRGNLEHRDRGAGSRHGFRLRGGNIRARQRRLLGKREPAGKHYSEQHSESLYPECPEFPMTDRFNKLMTPATA